MVTTRTTAQITRSGLLFGKGGPTKLVPKRKSKPLAMGARLRSSSRQGATPRMVLNTMAPRTLCPRKSMVGPRSQTTGRRLRGGSSRETAITTKPPARKARVTRSVSFLDNFRELSRGSKIYLLRVGHFDGFPYPNKAHLMVEESPVEDAVSGQVTVKCSGEIPTIGWVRLRLAAHDVGVHEVGGHEYWPGMELPAAFGFIWSWYMNEWGGESTDCT